MGAFDKKLRLVRLRCGLNALLDRLAFGLLAGGLAAVAAVAFERLLVPDLPLKAVLIGLAALSVGVSVVFWLLRMPGRMEAAVLIDERLKLHARFSTALALADSTDPFARAASKDAHGIADRVRLRGAFPLRPSRRWLGAGAAWVAAMAATFLPAADLLGYQRQRKQQEQETDQLRHVQADVTDASERIGATVRQLGQPELEEMLADMRRTPEQARPGELRRQAIRKLGDLSETLRETGSQQRFEAHQELRRQLRQLRDTPEGLSSEFYQALASGRFEQAAGMLTDLREQLDDGELSEQQKQALARQMEDLAGQLRELGDEQRAVSDKLRRRGLGEDLAGLSEDELRKALREKGLSGEQIEELFKSISACKSACGSSRELAGLMAAAGSKDALDAGKLGAAAEALSRLEQQDIKRRALEAALAQVDEEIKRLGGQAGADDHRATKGLALHQQRPSSSAGLGRRPDSAQPTEHDDGEFTPTVAPTMGREGRILASWYVRGDQIRGEASEEFAEVVRASSDRAAEAINHQQIPRRYEAAIKSYYRQFGGADDEAE